MFKVSQFLEKQGIFGDFWLQINADICPDRVEDRAEKYPNNKKALSGIMFY
jgi:hypothetical protein